MYDADGNVSYAIAPRGKKFIDDLDEKLEIIMVKNRAENEKLTDMGVGDDVETRE